MTLRSLPHVCIACLIALSTGGCARSVPLLSHAHVGHAANSWRDAPDKAGVFVVAEREAMTALEQACMAIQASGDSVAAKRHFGNVGTALQPDGRSEGAGLGYGAIQALEDAVHHLTFAAESDDASANIVARAAQFTEGAGEVAKRFQVMLTVARVAESADVAELPGLAAELEQLAHASIHGEDLDDDGVLGNKFEEYGLHQLRLVLADVIHMEAPDYDPIGRLHLFGQIRLPASLWASHFAHTQLYPGDSTRRCLK